MALPKIPKVVSVTLLPYPCHRPTLRPLMPSSSRASFFQPPPPATPAETALYTRDLLESLRKIAQGQGHALLAHLLQLAALEAKAIADQAQETRLPG